MKQEISVTLYAGGQGSGCNGPNCGRPAGHKGEHVVSKHSSAKISSDKGKGHTKRLTTFSTGHTIETWYDKSSKNWVTYAKSPDSRQLGAADYNGNKDSAKFAHEQMVKEFKKGAFDEEYQDKLNHLKYYPGADKE